jgi:hypothetical protein
MFDDTGRLDPDDFGGTARDARRFSEQLRPTCWPDRDPRYIRLGAENGRVRYPEHLLEVWIAEHQLMGGEST